MEQLREKCWKKKLTYHSWGAVLRTVIFLPQLSQVFRAEVVSSAPQRWTS